MCPRFIYFNNTCQNEVLQKTFQDAEINVKLSKAVIEPRENINHDNTSI